MSSPFSGSPFGGSGGGGGGGAGPTTNPVSVAEGGTGANSAAGARTNLGIIGDAPSNGGDYVRRSAAWQRAFLTTGYVSGSWYRADIGLTLGTTAAMAASTVYFAPLVLYRDAIITDLAAEITTAVAGANFQIAVYGMDQGSKLPAGAALATTGSLSAATATQVSATLAAPLALPAGMYWLALNQDAAVAYRNIQSAQGWTTDYLGGLSLSDVLKAAPAQYSVQIAQTFGTWPDMTGASFLRSAGANNRNPVGAFRVQ